MPSLGPAQPWPPWGCIHGGRVGISTPFIFERYRARAGDLEFLVVKRRGEKWGRKFGAPTKASVCFHEFNKCLEHVPQGGRQRHAG